MKVIISCYSYFPIATSSSEGFDLSVSILDHAVNSNSTLPVAIWVLLVLAALIGIVLLAVLYRVLCRAPHKRSSSQMQQRKTEEMLAGCVQSPEENPSWLPEFGQAADLADLGVPDHLVTEGSPVTSYA